MKKILITRKLILSSEKRAAEIFDVKLNKEDRLLTKDELISKSRDCDGILSSLTEKFDSDVIRTSVAGNTKLTDTFLRRYVQ